MDSKPEYTKFFIGALIVAAFAIPVFRSGGRTGLTFAGWIWNHTIFGPRVEYVPEESYRQEIEGSIVCKEIELIPSRNIDKIIACEEK